MKSVARRLTCDALAIEDAKERRAALNVTRPSAGISGALALACIRRAWPAPSANSR